MKRAFFIDIEGIDGSGKSTEVRLLVSHLRKKGQRVRLVKFPRHGHPSAWAVDQYLNGRFGSADELGPYIPGLFYALSRFAGSFEIRRALARREIVISDRYVMSSLAHQGGKVSDIKRRRSYIKWTEDLEYRILGIPEPDLTIVLDVPFGIAQRLIGEKRRRSYITRGRRDIHERDRGHLERAAAVYRSLHDRPNVYVINCAPKGQLLSIAEIHEKIWKIVTKKLERRK